MREEGFHILAANTAARAHPDVQPGPWRRRLRGDLRRGGRPRPCVAHRTLYQNTISPQRHSAA